MINLEILSLPSNKISSLYPLSKCKNLREINLRNNKVFSFDQLYFLKNLKKLKILCLEGNPISYNDNYMEKILEILPNLHYLDNRIVSNCNNINIRNRKYKYMKRVLTEEKKVRIDFDDNKNIPYISNNKANNNKKIILKRVFSYFDSSNNEGSKENSNNISKNKNNYNQYLKLINKDKGQSERKKEINFKNIKLKFKRNKRTICKNILLNNCMKQYPKITYCRKQNTKILFKGKNILNKKKKGNIKNLKFYNFIETNKNDNNYVMAASLLVNKININDLILLKDFINKKIELLTK
jgi:hypothetical protein